MSSGLRLLTIRMSHYCEKARWALDYHKIPYTELAYMPSMHMVPLTWLRMTGQAPGGTSERTSTKNSTPVLVIDGKATAQFLEARAGVEGRDAKVAGPLPKSIHDSTDIARWADANFAGAGRGPLFTGTEADELELRFSRNLGPHSRRLAYFFTLQDVELARAIARLNVAATQARLVSTFAPLVRNFLLKSLNITRPKAMRSLEVVEQEFAFANELLSDGRPFLAGDSFSIADISFAAMAAPALLIRVEEGFNARMPYREEVAQEYVDISERLRDTASGRHALRMFAEFRGSPQNVTLPDVRLGPSLQSKL